MRLQGNSSLTVLYFLKVNALNRESDSKEKTHFVVNLALNSFLIVKLAYLPKQVEESCDCHVHSGKIIIGANWALSTVDDMD